MRWTQPMRCAWWALCAPSEDNATGSNWGAVLYTPELTEHLIEQVDESPAVQAQEETPGTDIFTGLPFEENTVSLSMDAIELMISQMPGDQAAELTEYIDGLRAEGMSDEDIAAAFSEQLASQTDNATYEGNLEILGKASLDEPSSISIYPVDFEAKEQIDELIEEYNEQVRQDGEGTEIQYTDVVGMLMSSVTDIVNALTYILIAFVAISLVVSSIMIGIITYLSVLERTKEIGILRAIGASKKDVSRIFTAETFIIGLVSGVLGIAVTVALDIPVNMIIYQVAGVENLAAVPLVPGIALVLISVGLSVHCGARAEPHGREERSRYCAAHGVAGAGRPVGCLPAAGCRRGAWRSRPYLPEYAKPGSKVVEGRSYLPEYAKPGSKAAAAERKRGGGWKRCRGLRPNRPGRARRAAAVRHRPDSAHIGKIVFRPEIGKIPAKTNIKHPTHI